MVDESPAPVNTPQAVSAGTQLQDADRISPRERYSRQILFAGIGPQGQELLRSAHAAVVGVGATGAAAAGLLARAGVGTLTLIDRDFVEPSNLQRQVLFTENDALQSLPKAVAARNHLAKVNSDVDVQAHVADLVPANVDEVLRSAQIVLDCTDNYETRYLLNDYCVQEGKPWIYTAAVGSYAATLNILPRPAEDAMPALWRNDASPTACLACLFPQAPGGDVPTCETAGILGTAVNLAASLAVTEALKLLTGQPGAMRRTLLSFDLWSGERSEIRAGTPLPGCPVCACRRFDALAGQSRPHITLCGRNSVQIHEHHRPLDLQRLGHRLQSLGEVRANGLLLRFRYAPYTLTIFPDGRALIQGTTDPGLARSLYARFIGS